MIKYFCNHCGKELTESDLIRKIKVSPVMDLSDDYDIQRYYTCEVCEDCFNKYFVQLF